MKGNIQSVESLLTPFPASTPIIKGFKMVSLLHTSAHANTLQKQISCSCAEPGTLQTPTRFFSGEIQVADTCQKHAPFTPAAVLQLMPISAQPMGPQLS